MNIKIEKLLNQLKLMVICGILIMVGQVVAGGPSFIEAIPGIILIIAVSMTSLILKDIIPGFKFPAFAWATLLGFLLSMPMSPTSKMFLNYTNSVGFLSTTTPILAFAGVSVGNKIGLLKKMSWKLVVISLIVFASTYFGSALVAQMLLSFQGKI